MLKQNAMDSNVFRCGNIINRKYSSGELVESQIDGYDFWHFEKRSDINHLVEWNSVYPIELNHEWLIKLGFKPFCKDYQKNGIIIHTRKRGFVLNRKVPVIKFVHELQNLYFVLRGENLCCL